MSKAPATCDGCGKVWQVADASRTYKCRQCGGNVRAAPAQAGFEPAPAGWREDAPAPITCALCKTANDAEQRFCTECGAPLSEAPAVPASVAAPGDRVDAGIRSREIKSARETLEAARALFLSNACVMLLLATAAAAGYRDIPVFVAGVLAGMCAIYAVAGIRISREPFFWSVLAAALMTLNWASFVWFIVATEGLSYVGVRWVVLIGAWVAAGWVLVTAVARNRQLIADTPGIMKVPKLERGPQHRRAVAEPHSWRMAVIILLVAGVAWGAWVSLDTEKKPPAPPPLDAAASEFLQAWNASRHADVKNMLPEKVREMGSRQLDVVIRKRGWSTQLPKITLFKIEYPDEGRAYAVFPMEDGEIETRWRFEDGRWWLSTLRPLP